MPATHQGERAIKSLTVEVSIVRGEGLAIKDRNVLGIKTTSDPYVVVDLNLADGVQHLGKTKVIPTTLNPVWNESFSARLPAVVLTSKPQLVLSIFDHDILRKDDAMGVVTVDLPVSSSNHHHDTQWYDIPKESAKHAKGRIKVGIKTKLNHTNTMSVIETASPNVPNLLQDHHRGTSPIRSRGISPVPVRNNGFNILAGSMVSKEHVLSQLDQLETSPQITRVELEDCFVASRSDHAIAERLKEILKSQDERPWERIHFTDDVADGWKYPDVIRRRKRFLEALEEESKLIRVTFRTRILHLTDSPTVKLGVGRHAPQTGFITTLPDLIREFQRDPSVVSLELTSNKASPELIQVLTELLECDGRVWEEVKLELTCSDIAHTMTEEETVAMQEATVGLQKAAKAKHLKL